MKEQTKKLPDHCKAKSCSLFQLAKEEDQTAMAMYCAFCEDNRENDSEETDQ